MATPFADDRLYDFGVDEIYTNGDRLDIQETEPSTYAEATSTYTLGNKTSLSVGAPENGDANGRKVVVAAITDGTVSGTGTATYFTICDTGNSRLLIKEELASPQGVSSGNTFTLTEFDITIPDVA